MLHRILCFLVLSALFAEATTPQASTAATASDTPVLRVFRLWLDAFNAGDKTKLDIFWSKYRAPNSDPRTSGDLGLRKMTGSMRILEIKENTGTHLVAVMQEANGGYSESTLDLASVDPPVIMKMSGHRVPPPSDARPVAANDEDLANQVRKHVAGLSAPREFSGAILISHNGEKVLDQAWGIADVEKKTKNSVQTQFCLGSMNKMFTAVAVLQLVEKGKLSLDSPMSTYWPDYPNRDLASRVTVRQLLSHTAGTGDIFTPEYLAQRQTVRTLADYVKLFGNRSLRFTPGTRMEYSNYGFILLGRLIEVVSGQSYDAYVREHIFEVTGMFQTDSRPEADRVPGRAIGYTRGQGGLALNTALLPWSGTSAGGGYSTVGDLLLFAQALGSEKLLTSPLLAEATAPASVHSNYGLGFYILPNGGYGHGGGAPGVNAELHILPRSRYVVVALVNRDPPMATEMVDFIESILPSRREA
jgi:CubicO group peptidase (beta-lactamase class C family)